jgi:hypothetical protein
MEQVVHRAGCVGVLGRLAFDLGQQVLHALKARVCSNSSSIL